MADAYFIPNGPKNLTQIFPSVDWNKVQDYYVQISDSNGNVIATTGLNVMGCCCSPDRVRVMFLNYLGGWDCINFGKPSVVHESTDASYQQSSGYPLQKTDTGIERMNVRSNDTYEVISECYQEEDMPWLQELIDSPKAFIEWKGIEGQPDSYLPIVVLNAKMDKIKNKDDYIYLFKIQFKLSNEFYSLRN